MRTTIKCGIQLWKYGISIFMQAWTFRNLWNDFGLPFQIILKNGFVWFCFVLFDFISFSWLGWIQYSLETWFSYTNNNFCSYVFVYFIVFETKYYISLLAYGLWGRGGWPHMPMRGLASFMQIYAQFSLTFSKNRKTHLTHKKSQFTDNKLRLWVWRHHHSAGPEWKSQFIDLL